MINTDNFLNNQFLLSESETETDYLNGYDSARHVNFRPATIVEERCVKHGGAHATPSECLL